MTEQEKCEYLRKVLRQRTPEEMADYEEKARNVLHRLGFNLELRGTMYILDAMLQLIEFPTKLIGMSIYGEIAEKRNTTKEQVNTSIRYAIQRAWYFEGAKCEKTSGGTYNPFEQDFHPANLELIAAAAEMTRYYS